MDIVQNMRTVLAIAEKGSLTAAANFLETSLPTVVRVLATTEQHLGVCLFDRTTRRVRLTEEGRLYVETCRHVLGEIAEIEDIFRDRRKEPTGNIRITAPVLFGQLHVSPVINGYLAQYPDVTATLLLLDRVVDLVEEGIDIAVRIGPVAKLDLITTEVGSVRQYLCAAPSLLDAYAPVSQASDLAEMPFIQNVSLTPNSYITLGNSTNRHDIKLNRIRFSTNNVEAAISACVNGIGVGVFLSYQIQDAVAAGQITILLRELSPEPLPVSLVYSPTRRLSARHQTFLAWSKNALGQRLKGLEEKRTLF